MVYVIAGMLVLLALFAGRLWRYRQEMDSLLRQMELFGQEHTNYCLSSSGGVKRTRMLINALNEIRRRSRGRYRDLREENRRYKESITGISHDIRTPLTSARGYAQMLLSGSVEDAGKQRLYAENILCRIDDVTKMLDMLFEYARLEAGELKFKYEILNLNNLFADALSMFYEDFVRKGCEPVAELGGEPCYISADRGAVLRIMENIIKNALVHGNGNYRFCLKRDGAYVYLTASNTTGSIEQADMEHIFDRFYTTDQSRTLKSTGLGLALVKGLARQMGGSVRATLEGDVFTLCVGFTLCQGKR